MSWRDEVQCPHCGFAQEDLFELGWGAEQEQSEEMDCQSCERPITVKLTIESWFTVSRPKEATP